LQRKDVINILKLAGESNCKFLFVSPERLETALFKEFLPGLGVCLLAVDEAHCISQWGYDFRPPYLRIADLREDLPGIPVLALTASATPAVQVDICEKLEFTEPHIFRQSFERPKLSYSVSKTSSKIPRIIEILQKVPGTGIVYCKSRKRTREIADLLRLQNISADHYHAGLTGEERNAKQEAWIRNETRVIVCTNAFGMGIDKPDVRVVIHADVPDCLENYYQEAGRAGRDGKIAYAVLLYDEQDLASVEDLVNERFPGPAKVREVYQAVGNYLQVATGAGEGASYDFTFQDFLKKFRLAASPTLYALRLLEQEGWLAFNEQVFKPSRLKFNCTKTELFEFEKNFPQYEELVKTLLRSYEGIYDQFVFISEKMIGGILHREQGEINRELQLIARAGIIEYEPQSDQPQLTFLRERIRTEDLRFDGEALEKRKIQYADRVGQMRKYLLDVLSCRSKSIASYFGDPGVRACGICDNCLKLKSTEISEEEFVSLTHRILNIVKYEQLAVSELVDRLAGARKEKIWKLMDFLQAENKITMNEKGKVILG
jgi:ATP-dependent DNA helicase RecQ